MSNKDITKDLGIYWPQNKKMKIPRILDKYTILKRIAETNSAVVVSAKMKKSSTKFAIKCIPIDFYENYKNEMDFFAVNTHPNIIECIESFKYPPTKARFYAIVMPCAIRDMVKYLEFHHYIEEPLACTIMREILSAVQYFHARDIIHRDLKCDNIFIMEENLDGLRIAIGDFGLAVHCNGSSINGIPSGTIVYAPPEILVKNKDKAFGIGFNNHKVTCLFSSILILI